MTPLQKKTVKAIINVFETGRVAGNYSSVTVLPGDSGHLTYGRSQLSLGSGSLFELLTQYCAAPGVKFGAALEPFLPRIQSRDAALDGDRNLRVILEDAGSDPLMQVEQDRFFDAKYFDPACNSAARFGFASALAHAVVYDSCVQGNWIAMREATVQKCGGSPGGKGISEQQWVEAYVRTRKAWLLNARPPLPATAYRMDAFLELISGGKWDLPLPVSVRGVTISERDLDGDGPAAARNPAKLRLI